MGEPYDSSDGGRWRLATARTRGAPPGSTLVRKPYRAKDESWEHDHCEFCWTKFMDPTFSDDHAEFIADHTDVLTEGFAVQGRSPEGGTADDYWWICPPCVADFSQCFEWTVL